MTTPDPSVLFDHQPDKLAIAGDWHGSGAWAEHAIQHASRHGADTIFQVGDFGFWRKGWGTDNYLDTVERALREAGIRLYWLDGNHEDHSRREEFNDPAHRPLTTYVPRGTRWEWWGKRWMAVGGAFSIDRFMRKPNISYWDEELLSDEELDWACHQPHGMDVILTHDCPTGVNIPGIGPDSKPRGGADQWPADMLLGARAHRLKMRQIWEKHQPQLWIHGHYHVAYEYWLRETKFVGLDCDGTKMLENVMFLTPDDLK